MPKALFDITADVGRESRSPSVTAKQFDKDSRFLRIHIVNHSKPIAIAQDSSVIISAERPDGEAKAFSGRVNPDGTATVPLTDWMLAVEGELRCDVSVVGSDGTKLTTTAFNISVERPSYSGEDISDEPQTLDIITEILTQMSGKMPNYKIGPGLKVSEDTIYVTAGIGDGGSATVDPTLTLEGAAADAKATGEAIRQIKESGAEKEWYSGLFTVQPWLDGDVQIKTDPNGDAWGYCHTFTGLEPNTFYTISISEPDNATCYIGTVYGGSAVSENGGYQSYMTDENGNLDIYLLRKGYWWPTESRYDDYLNGTLKACLVKGTEAYFQGDSTICNAWKLESTKQAYSQNTQREYKLSIVPGNVHNCAFDFGVGGYYSSDNTTEGHYPYAILSIASKNESTLNLFSGDSMLDLTMLPVTDENSPARSGITLYGNDSLRELADFYLNFVDRAAGTNNPAFTVRRNARPVDFTKDGIAVQNAAGEVKTVDLYELDSKASALDGGWQVSVASYGAKGDGVSDDTIAIQSALDSMKNGGTIVFPTGVYKITAPLLVYSNQTLEMNGSTILQGGAIDNLMRNYNSRDDASGKPGLGGYSAAQNVKILNGVFDGGDYTADNTLLGFEHSENILIEGCVFKNGYGAWHDIEINSTKYAAIRGCIFEDTRRTGQNACSIQIDAYNNEYTWPWMDGVVDGTLSDKVTIDGCRFECSALAPAVGNHSSASANNIIITGSSFENGLSERGVISFYTAKNVFVTGNIFNSCNTNFAENVTANNNLIDGELSVVGGSSTGSAFTVEQNLTNCTSSNSAVTAELGAPYMTTLTASEGYAVSLVTVKMAGMDITSAVYSGGLISIPSVSGKIVINAVAEQENSGYTAVYAIPSSGIVNCMLKPDTNNKTANPTRVSYTARDLILEPGATYKITYAGAVRVGVQQYNQRAYDVGMDGASYVNADKIDSGWQSSGYEWVCPEQINGYPTKGAWLTFETGDKSGIGNIVIYRKG